MTEEKKSEQTKRLPKMAFSWIALVLVVAFEALLWWYARSMDWRSFKTLATIAIVLLTVLWVASWLCGYKFIPKSEILTKLLANAVSPQLLGVWYLLMFAIHIGWLADSMMYLYLQFKFDLPIVYASIAICILGLAVLVVFFPDGSKRKNKDAVRVFISGISPPSMNPDPKKLNLKPLVRVLQNVDDGNCELLILRSDFAPSDEKTLTAGINNVLTKYCNVKEASPEMKLPEKLKVVIREVAKQEFPEKKWIDSMPIHITEPCNYNMFSQCYATLRPWIKKYDDDKHRLAFNVTPGTAVVSSLMTLMAIHAERDLYYYSQDDSLDDDKRLTIVDKENVPLRSLLSQAIEHIEKDKNN